jgi:hypothetical protein
MAEWAGGALEVIDGAPVASNDDVRKYVVEIEVYDRVSQKFRTRGNKILRRYRDERRTADEDQIKFNILWSNIQTLLPACYAKNPKPECERRFKDDDPVGRVGSEILERSITYYMDCGDFFDSARSATLDRLLPGRGQMWVRYVPHFRDVDNDSDDAGTPEVKQEGPEVTDSSDEMVERDASMIGSDPSDVEDGQEVEYEEVCCDYVHWENFGHNVARTWDEVYLVWRMVFLDRDELIERFGADLGKRIPLDYSPKNLAEEKITQEMKKATVYEMWDKRCKKAFWVSKKVPEFLDERDDPLKLEKFFPCPKPLLATVANDSILPTADYSEYQDQARELDALTARIAAVTRALKVAGVYASDATGIDRLLSEGTENQLIPIEQWAMFAEKGGLKGVFELFPIQDIAQTLLAMYQARDKIKADLYEVSGMPDIIRGANDPRSTATAESIKGQYASIRLRSVQDEVQRFMRDMIRLMGEVIANHISYQTLAQVSGVKLMTRMEKMQAQMPQQQYQQAMQQYQAAGQHVKQMQASGQPMPPGFQPPPPPQPPPPLPAAVQEQLSEPSWEDVEDMLRSNAMRTFRLDIETDSTIGDDDETTKQQRLEFLKVLGPLIAQAVQAGETNPTMVPMMIESIKWAVRAFPQARSLEGIIDQTLDLLAKQPPPPKPNPEAIKAQAQQQAQQAKMQGEQQIQQMRAQTDQQIEAGKVQGQIQVENVKAQAQIQIGQAQQQAQAAQAQQENELEAKRDLLKAQTEVQIAQVKGDVDFRIAVAVARIHAEATIAAARINSKTSPSDGTADLAYQELHETEAGNGVAMVSGPGEPPPQPQGSDDADL